LAHEPHALAHVDRDGRRRNCDRPPFRRDPRRSVGARRVRHLRDDRALGREHPDARAAAGSGRALPVGRGAARRAGGPRGAIAGVLDAMEIVPAFAYLMPVVILFSVGPGAAVITTMVYAVPPAVRITALGIRGVPPNTIEAAQAMGATVPQELAKVQLPLARR